MRAPPPITVVTTTYNWPKALAQAIPTVLAQTFTDFEYLIIGDACNDETEDLVRSFDDPRIIWHNLPENTGNQSGVNKVALRMAQGKAIAYLNHDDLWFEDHLKTLIDPLVLGDLDIVHSLALEVAAPGSDFRGLLGMLRKTPDSSFTYTPMTSNVIHTAAAARAAGGWIDWRETKHIPTLDFFRRVSAVRGRFGAELHITSVKFHSGDRLNSYALKEAREQERYAELMRTDPQLRYREAIVAFASLSMHERCPKLAAPPMPSDAAPGWQIEQWRRLRGLRPMLELGASEPGQIAPVPVKKTSPIRVDENRRAYFSQC